MKFVNYVRDNDVEVVVVIIILIILVALLYPAVVTVQEIQQKKIDGQVMMEKFPRGTIVKHKIIEGKIMITNYDWVNSRFMGTDEKGNTHYFQLWEIKNDD